MCYNSLIFNRFSIILFHKNKRLMVYNAAKIGIFSYIQYLFAIFLASPSIF